jgi:hypothetical protein
MATYLNQQSCPNLFVFACIIIQYAAQNDPYAALLRLKQADAFTTNKNRLALLRIIRDARDSKTLPPCGAMLDILEKYTTFAFSLEDDRLSVGCGTIPVREVQPPAATVCTDENCNP